MGVCNIIITRKIRFGVVERLVDTKRGEELKDVANIGDFNESLVEFLEYGSR
jgi:hypothetical protein